MRAGFPTNTLRQFLGVIKGRTHLGQALCSRHRFCRRQGLPAHILSSCQVTGVTKRKWDYWVTWLRRWEMMSGGSVCESNAPLIPLAGPIAGFEVEAFCGREERSDGSPQPKSRALAEGTRLMAEACASRTHHRQTSCRSPVLKTGRVTGPPSLPQRQE